MSDTGVRPGPLLDVATVGPLLRERVYVTLTGLATVMVMLTSPDLPSPGSAAVNLAVSMGGLWAASLVADFVSHTAVHGDTPDDSQWRHIGVVAAQALEIAIVPVLAVALAATRLWTVQTGLIVAAASLVLTQGVVALWAVRHRGMSAAKRCTVVAGEVVLGALVVVIKLLAH